MHIPDGFLDTKTWVSTALVSGAALTYAVKKTTKELKDKQVPLMGVTAAFIFAAQMLNFPVIGGTSGHFLGAVFAAILLGPWAACLIMAMVLALQCLIFQDGGLTALGANIFNMGIIGAILGYYIYVGIKKVLPGRKRMLVAAFVASWASVVLASAACAAELAISGNSPFIAVFSSMVSVHMLIGIGEGLITTAAIAVVARARADLLERQERVESEF